MTSKGVTKKPARKAGIAGDEYVVEFRGNGFYVVNALRRVTVAGPYKTRDEGQRRADELQRMSGR